MRVRKCKQVRIDDESVVHKQVNVNYAVLVYSVMTFFLASDLFLNCLRQFQYGFRCQGSLYAYSNPAGSVSIISDVADTCPILSDIMRTAVRRFASLSPRLLPRERYSICQSVMSIASP